MNLENAIKQFLAIKNKDTYIAGRNPELENFYAVWKGKPKWLDYTIYYPDKSTRPGKLKTLNMPKYLAQDWANNYANENTNIVIPNANDEEVNNNNLLQKIFKDNNFFSRFNNFVESFMALGLGAIVVNTTFAIDEDNNTVKNDSKVKINYVGGRRVYPITIDDGVCTECTFVSYRTNGCKISIHWLDEHGNYVISDVKGKSENGSSNYNFDFNNIEEINTGANIPLFTLWYPNIADDEEIDGTIGTSVFANALDTFQHCDLDYTILYDELDNGRKVKFISPSMQQKDENGNIIVVGNPNDASVVMLPEGDDGKTLISEFNGELRIDSIVKALNFNMNVAAMLCGLGSSRFEYDGGGGRPIQTATGVIAKNNELYRNVIKQENFATDNFRKLVNAIIYVNNVFTTNPQIICDDINEIQVTYDDNLTEDTTSKKQQEIIEVQNGTMTIAEYRSHWYDEDYDSALAFVQENGLMIDKYINALQLGAMVPEQFIAIVFGEKCKYKNELLEQIKNMLSPVQMDNTYHDEQEQDTQTQEKNGGDVDEEQPNEQEEEEGNKE